MLNSFKTPSISDFSTKTTLVNWQKKLIYYLSYLKQFTKRICKVVQGIKVSKEESFIIWNKSFNKDKHILERMNVLYIDMENRSLNCHLLNVTRIVS